MLACQLWARWLWKWRNPETQFPGDMGKKPLNRDRRTLDLDSERPFMLWGMKLMRKAMPAREDV